MGITTNPWPGPRPLTEMDVEAGWKPVGRDGELGELISACNAADIVMITASSGVGKTTFIDAKAIPALRDDEQMEVIRSVPWADVLRTHDAWSEGIPPDERTTRREAGALYCFALGAASVVSPDKLIADRVAKQSAVVVFDQAEELLRYRRRLGRAFLRQVARAARRTKKPHIVIARAEFRADLRPLEEEGQHWHLPLSEITDPDMIAEIIMTPVELRGMKIEDDAVDRLIGWWYDARDAPVETHDGGTLRETLVDVGLLHLHALLWSVGQWLAAEEGESLGITDDDVQRFAASVVGSEPAEKDAVGGPIIERAIVRYVSGKIDELTTKERLAQLGITERLNWEAGPKTMLARSVPLLSSAGYKVPQALSSLLPAALRDELSAPEERRLREVARRSPTPEGIGRELPLRGAGIATTWEGWQVTAEIVNCLTAGLKALASSEANVLREFKAGADPIFDLVHDGLGRALNEWATTFLDGPESLVTAIVERSGQPITQDLNPAVFVGGVSAGSSSAPVTESRRVGDSSGVVLRNVRWRGNAVRRAQGEHVVFRDIAFEDCSFVGTAFLDVVMRNVEFVRCDFRGAVLLRCELDDVRFVSPGGDALGDVDAAGFDTLSITLPQPNARIRFSGLPGTTGLFIQGMRGGSLEFEDASVEHLVIESGDEPLGLGFGGTFTHVTLRAGCQPEVSAADATFLHVSSDPQGVLPDSFATLP